MVALMKGVTWAQGKARKDFSFPLIAEVKYDEVRVRAQRVHRDEGESVEFYSYAGNRFNNMETFIDGFLRLMQHWDVQSIDCGIEVNGSFNDTSRWVKTTTGWPKADPKTGAPATDPSMAKFYLFDLPGLIYDTYEVRRKYLKAIEETAFIWKFPLIMPEYVQVDSEEQVEAFYGNALDNGSEGLMLKTLHHKYEPGKRTAGWMKYKPVETADGKIVKLNEAHSKDGVPLGRVGSIDVELEDGSTASPGNVSHDLGKLMWDNPEQFIGQWLEFKYMMRDRQGGYRHPNFFRMRADSKD